MADVRLSNGEKRSRKVAKLVTIIGDLAMVSGASRLEQTTELPARSSDYRPRSTRAKWKSAQVRKAVSVPD